VFFFVWVSSLANLELLYVGKRAPIRGAQFATGDSMERLAQPAAKDFTRRFATTHVLTNVVDTVGAEAGTGGATASKAGMDGTVQLALAATGQSRV